MTKDEWFEVFRRVKPDLTREEFEREWDAFIGPRIAWNKRLDDRKK